MRLLFQIVVLVFYTTLAQAETMQEKFCKLKASEGGEYSETAYNRCIGKQENNTKDDAKYELRADYRYESHKKSKHVNYLPVHEFLYPKGQFFVDNMDRYRQSYIEFYGPYTERYAGNSTFVQAMNYIWVPRDGYGRTQYPCLKILNSPDYMLTIEFVQTHQDKFASDKHFRRHMKRKMMGWCAEKVKSLVHEDVIRDERNGDAITHFFEVLMPRFLDNDSWLALPFEQMLPGEDFIPEQQAIEHLLYTYLYFSDWYGTSDELDRRFVSYFHKFERTRHKHIKSDRDQTFITKCPLDISLMRPNWNDRINRNPDLDNYACKQEFYPMLYALMAVRFQDNDILNEALFFFKHNAKYTFEEGPTVEVMRGFRGPGYAMMAAEFFDQGAWVIEAFTDAKVYTIKGGGKYDTTVGKMIEGSIDAFTNPEKYFKYARMGQEAYGADYRKPDLPTIPHNAYRTVGAFLDGSKSGKWDQYLNNLGDPGFTRRLAIDPLLMSRAYDFAPSYQTE